MYRQFASLALVFILSCASFSQTLDKESPADKESRVTDEAVAFLRDTLTDVANLRTLENRISFNAQLASLLWKYDEKQAADLFTIVSNDFKSLILRYDMMAISVGLADTSEEYSDFSFFDGPTESARIYRKLQIAMAVRQQIAASIARNQPEAALSFFRESAGAITNKKFREDLAGPDANFERLLITRIGASKPETGLRLGKASLEKGLSSDHIDLLKALYKKDPETAKEFGAAIRSRLEKEKPSYGLDWMVEELMLFGEETLNDAQNKGAPKPVYSADDLRSIAETYLTAVAESNENYLFNIKENSLIAKYAPSRAAQVRAKFKKSEAAENQFDEDEAQSSAANSMSNASKRKQSEELWQETKKQIRTEFESIRANEVSKKERERIFAKAASTYMNAPSRTAKISGLSAIAIQAAKVGEKELAAEILNDAAGLVNPQPMTYADYSHSLILIAGYAEVQPEKAFPILEDAISRINDTIDAFIKVGEFIDLGGEIIVDGEVQLGAFGGQQLQSISNRADVATSTIRTLALSDFARTRRMAGNFERAEVRVFAKVLIIQAVLDAQDAAEPAEFFDLFD